MTENPECNQKECWCKMLDWSEFTSSYGKALEYYHKEVLKH